MKLVKCNSCQEGSTRKLVKMKRMHFKVCWSCFNIVTKNHIILNYLSHLTKVTIPTRFLIGPSVIDNYLMLTSNFELHICVVILDYS